MKQKLITGEEVDPTVPKPVQPSSATRQARVFSLRLHAENRAILERAQALEASARGRRGSLGEYIVAAATREARRFIEAAKVPQRRVKRGR